VAAGDFDNDGWEDLFLPSGMGYPWFYWPNAMLMNNGNGTFTDRAAALGLEPPREGENLNLRFRGKPATRSSRAAAAADFNRDGRLDMVVNNFNDRPYYFINNLPRRNFIAFRLTGSRSNRDAIGAVVRLYAGPLVMTRIVQPVGGYLAQGSKTVHFGLGDRSSIDRVEIRWPGGRLQSLDAPELNAVHDVVEP
jgi:hypothetical protein